MRYFFIFSFIFLLIGCVPKNLPDQNIQIWGVFDETTQILPILHEKNKNVKYRKFLWTEYRQTLENELKNDRGPDLFLIPQNWAGDFKPFLQPLPGTPHEFFPAAQKLQKNETEMWALPIEFDALVMFWNPLGIARAPKTWERFVELAHQKPNLANFGPNAKDAEKQLQLLQKQTCQIQNGQHDKNCSADRIKIFFDSFGKDGNNEIWTGGDEIDAFLSGKIPIFFGFKYHDQKLQKIEPKITMPPIWQKQIGETTVADFWIIAMKKNAKKGSADLAEWLAKDGNKKYTQKTGKISGWAKNTIPEPWQTARVIAR